MRSLAVTLGVVAVAFALGTVQWHAPRGGSELTSLRADSDAAAHEARVAVLETDIARLRATLAELSTPGKATAPSAPAPSSVASPGSEPRGRSHAEHLRALETQLAEPEDPSWARGAETELFDLYAPMQVQDPQLQLVDLRCRKTLCRVEWSTPSDTDVAPLRDVPWEGSSIFVQTPRDDGTSSLVAYIGRTAAALP